MCLMLVWLVVCDEDKDDDGFVLQLDEMCASLQKRFSLIGWPGRRTRIATTLT